MAKSTKEEKLIKQVNERIKDVARLLGTDSKLYNDYKSRVDKVFDTSQYHISSKDGVIQISHGKKVQGIEDLEERLNFIKRLPTKGEVLRRSKNSLKEEGEKTTGRKGRENVVERSKQIDLINDFFENEKDNIYKFEEFADIRAKLRDNTRGSRLSYDELADLIQEYYRRKEALNTLTPSDLFKDF